LRQSYNQWRALQKLYQDCGWGSETFDGEAFERKRREWIAEKKIIERVRRDFLGSTMFPRYGQEQQYQLPYELWQRWDDFWTKSAGEHAV